MKTNLTPSQSQRLIELGVDPSKASSQNIYMKQGFGSRGVFKTPVAQPIFTHADILLLLPKEIDIHPGDDTLGMVYHCGQWRVGYSNYKVFCDHTKVAPELIDALFELLIWILQNHPDKIKRL